MASRSTTSAWYASADEKLIAGTSLDRAFYKYLAGFGEIGQVYVVEIDPPAQLPAGVNVERFSSESRDGRQGMFPAG